MEARLSKFKELNDTFTPSQQGSRITHQTHDAIYALIATIQERCDRCLLITKTLESPQSL